MITKTIDENWISVIPEDSEDLLNLRRIIKENDKVTFELKEKRKGLNAVNVKLI
jgi:stalled ribosome rescue protein Dom34